MNPIHILLVDGNRAFLSILTRFLQEDCQGQVLVVGTAAGAEEALAQARALRPHVVLIDMSLRDISGLKALPQLRSLLPEATIIIAMAFGDTSLCRFYQLAAIAMADDFIPKEELATRLLPTIQCGMQVHQPDALS